MCVVKRRFDGSIHIQDLKAAGVEAGTALDPDGARHRLQENLALAARHLCETPAPEMCPSVRWSLERRSGNRFDPNAVAVMAAIDPEVCAACGVPVTGADAARPRNVQVGWLPKETARLVAPVMDGAGEAFVSRALVLPWCDGLPPLRSHVAPLRGVPVAHEGGHFPVPYQLLSPEDAAKVHLALRVDVVVRDPDGLLDVSGYGSLRTKRSPVPEAAKNAWSASSRF